MKKQSDLDYTVFLSIYIYWAYEHCVVKPNCSTFRITTVYFGVSQFLESLGYNSGVWNKDICMIPFLFQSAYVTHITRKKADIAEHLALWILCISYTRVSRARLPEIKK